MTKLNKQNFILLFCLSLIAGNATVSKARDRYSQMVMSFPNSRAFDYQFNERENALVINIKDTLAKELEPFFHYDESLIRRILFRDQGGQETQVRMVFRDPNVRASVYSFNEPFRIVIDLFDANFQELRDPTTGLPLAHINSTPDRQSHDPRQGNNQRLLKNSPENQTPKSLTSNDQEPPSQGSQRRLLQPTPPSIQSSRSLIENLSEAPAGISKQWQHYPIYIYRIQTEPYKSGKSYESWMKRQANEAMASEKAMADYAGQLYDFGHESRALLAYQKVLHQSPLVFDKRADHLWRLAEIHFGQGNLTLADGYYTSLTEKHPDHPLTQFAEMRRLDIKALRAIDRGRSADLRLLLPHLDKIRTQDLSELRAQLAIRNAFWQSDDSRQHERDARRQWLPALSPEALVKLEQINQAVENPRTAFLLATLRLNSYLAESAGWNEQTAAYADEYFKTYRGQATEPFRSQLLKASHSNIHKHLTGLVESGQILRAVNSFEALPDTLNSVRESVDTSWAMAEAYRQVQQPAKAAPFYKLVADQTNTSPHKFRAQFWHLQSLKASYDIERARGGSGNQVNRLRQEMQTADQQCLRTWSSLKENEQRQLLVEFKPELEAGIQDSVQTITHPTLLLWAWSQSLGTQTPSTIDSTDPLGQLLSANDQTVFLISQLAKRFGELGQQHEQQKAKDLLRYLQPSTFRQNKEATQLWARELVELAEIHRRNNQYLEAGRLYALTGSQGESWEGRAEALYKGGLLLYRSGRREEALEAFNQAATDGNNLLYANLAKQRIEQLQE